MPTNNTELNEEELKNVNGGLSISKPEVVLPEYAVPPYSSNGTGNVNHDPIKTKQ